MVTLATTEQSEKLHSRAREVKTCSCTEAPDSKSLGRVEIWLLIYEGREGLESFTRDPIGYEGSEWGLYEFCDAAPLDHTDAHGKQAVNCAAKNADCIAGAGVNDSWCKGRIKPLCFTYCVLLLRRPPWIKDPWKDGCLKVLPVFACEAACEPIYEAACNRDTANELGCCAASLVYCNANGSWPNYFWRVANGCRL